MTRALHKGPRCLASALKKRNHICGGNRKGKNNILVVAFSVFCTHITWTNLNILWHCYFQNLSLVLGWLKIWGLAHRHPLKCQKTHFASKNMWKTWALLWRLPFLSNFELHSSWRFRKRIDDRWIEDRWRTDGIKSVPQPIATATVLLSIWALVADLHSKILMNFCI